MLILFWQIPMLLEATSDDAKPTPGYVFKEITSILTKKKKKMARGTPIFSLNHATILR